MATLYDTANWMINNGTEVTNKKLQKLVYYTYAWFIALNNESKDNIENRFFEARFEAWVHGAVCPDLYDKYKKHGSKTIPCQKSTGASFSADELDVLEQVRDVYDKYNGNELESICHQESPWINARAGLQPYEPSHNVISDADIYECYAARL